MHLLTAEILVLMVTVLDGVQSELSLYGAHVCMSTETYREKTLVKSLKPFEETREKRCWNVFKFFSCKETVTVWKEHLEYLMVPRSKIVAKCCTGYVEVPREEGTRCEVPCRHICLHGRCVHPNDCACYSGFNGLGCSSECPEGYWGDKCRFECNCVNNAKCDNVWGCVCQAGWMGSKCESQCGDGYYGHSCEKKCDCNGLSCNHITGECITTTPEPTTSTSTTSITEILLPFTTESSTSDTAPIFSTSTKTSSEIPESSERSDTTNDVSTIQIFEIEKVSDRNIILSHTTTETKDEFSSEIVTERKIKLSEVDEYDSTKTTILTEPTTGDEITTLRIAAEDDEKEIKLVNSEIVSRKEMDVSNGREAISSTIFPLGTVNEPNIGKNKTSWISFTASKEHADKNRTDNFILEGKGNSRKEKIFEFLHFLPSLSVISAASFLIVIIAARWVIVTHRRKTRMLVVVASEKGNISQSEERIKFETENLFWVNNCTVNPVFMSDAELNNPTPVLETFKPVDKETASKGRTVL